MLAMSMRVARPTLTIPPRWRRRLLAHLVFLPGGAALVAGASLATRYALGIAEPLETLRILGFGALVSTGTALLADAWWILADGDR